MSIYDKIKKLSAKYEKNLKDKINERVLEMENDDKSHYLIYQVLGISEKEGSNIDIYQNKGRFLYKYAGAFLEEAAFLCIKNKYPSTEKVRIPNLLGSKPKTFEIDALVDKLYAIEIKWRDATTDGDHITKEHSRLNVIHQSGYIPVRLMFYYPNRTQAQRIQSTLETLYKGLNGKYYYGDNAWNYIKKFTQIDLLDILNKIAEEKKNEI